MCDKKSMCHKVLKSPYNCLREIFECMLLSFGERHGRKRSLQGLRGCAVNMEACSKIIWLYVLVCIKEPYVTITKVDKWRWQLKQHFQRTADETCGSIGRCVNIRCVGRHYFLDWVICVNGSGTKHVDPRGCKSSIWHEHLCRQTSLFYIWLL